MKRLSMIDTNTPEHYTELYFGERKQELLAYPHIEDLLPLLTPPYANVWDVGCGVGNYGHCFPSAVNVLGTELSPEAAEEAKKTGCYTEVVQWRVGTPDPFPNTSFDMIWAGEIIEHLEEPELLMDLMKAKLNDNGILVLTTPYQDSIICPEHIWSFDTNDIARLLSPLKISFMGRFCNEPVERWEHLLAIAVKE